MPVPITCYLVIYLIVSLYQLQTFDNHHDVRIRRTLLFRADPDMISKFENSAFSLAKPINQLTFSPKRPLSSTILSVSTGKTSYQGIENTCHTGRRRQRPTRLGIFSQHHLHLYQSISENNLTIASHRNQYQSREGVTKAQTGHAKDLNLIQHWWDICPTWLNFWENRAWQRSFRRKSELINRLS